MKTNMNTQEERDHAWQIEAFPRNARVKALAVVSQAGGYPDIPAGTAGTVTGHADDGRACISFDTPGGGHTFHYPEGFIEIISPLDDALAALRVMVGSARPNPVENPTMWSAWQQANAVLARNPTNQPAIGEGN
jgi:hypothetical protein